MATRKLAIEKMHAEEELKLAYAMLERRVEERTAELVRANDALFEERERALITLRSIADAVIVTDAHGCISQLNAAGEKLLGRRSAEVSGKQLPEVLPLIDEATRRPVDSAFWRTILEDNNATHPEPAILANAEGNEAVIMISAAPIRDHFGRISGAVVVLHDVTKERARTQMLAYQATHDTLTDLPNRSLFLDRLAHYLAHARRYEEKLAVVFLDLDGFKAVNDNFGHSAGDILLKSVAQRLKRCVRQDDSLARLAGDEFTMIVTGPDADRGVDNVATKVIGELCAPFEIEGREIQIGTSVGISVYPDDGSDVGVLMEKADMAMYRAKAGGGKGYHYFSK
jgi:diguanylate cyclase (GGDEF)-like protein/PAS domain S-box-containing protein